MQARHLTSRARKLFLVFHAAFGPTLLWGLYASARNRGMLSFAAPFDDLVLITAVLSGACGAYLGLPGSRLARSSLTVIYLICMTGLVLYVGIWFACSSGRCL
jgi:hypothetical protein